MKSKILLICLLATVSFAGCKKDEETPTPTPTPSSKKSILIDKSWKLTAFTVDPAYNYGGTGPMTNLIGYIAPCELNDITLYTTTNTYTIDEGATKCSASNPQTKESGSWAFNSGETALTRTPTGGIAKEYPITALSETTLSLTESLTTGGTTYVFTKTYTKQ
jgi:Lipocalin-like domain